MKIPSDAQAFVEKLRNGDRATLGSHQLCRIHRPRSQELKRTLISAVDGAQANAYRIAITGVPGVGKSTLIERFGLYLVEQANALRLARPFKCVSGEAFWAIRLACKSSAGIPMPLFDRVPRKTLGGVTAATHETALPVQLRAMTLS